MKRSHVLWVGLAAAAAVTVLGMYIDRRSKSQLEQPNPPVCSSPTLAHDEAPICRSAAEDDTARLEQLLDSGVPIDTPCSGERTPLFLACAMKQPATVRLLLARGASVAVTDRGGATLLHAAVGFGCTQEGRRVADDSEEVVRLLLERHVAVDAQDVAGDTALIAAARDGLASIVGRLLAAGARTEYRDESGRSALDWAEINKYSDIAELLRHRPQASNQAMQLTASKPDVHAWSVCRSERMLPFMHRGLAAADLVTR